ncbi:MAG: hypothetical protein V4438_01970 [Patescibacteria group bacterium]
MRSPWGMLIGIAAVILMLLSAAKKSERPVQAQTEISEIRK